MSNPKVCIAMAVYNGEKHIRVQMDSLLKQTYDNIQIVVRDDGSKDGTVSIVQEYAEKYPDKIILLENGGENLKCPGSFYRIIRDCEKAYYYAFCDQDDYWEPQKIQWAVEKLEAVKKEGKLYLSSYDYYTEDGQFIRHFPPQKDPIELKEVLYHTPGSGFTIVFDETIRQRFILQVNPGTEMHDRWLIRAAVCFGTVIYDPRSTARHIRHEEAVTAEDAGNKNLLVHFIKDELLSDVAVEAKRHLAYFYQTFRKELTEQDRKLISIFVKQQGGIKNWCQKVFYPGRLRSRVPGEVALRLLFLIGKI